jgi:hypothetical protein
MAYSEAFISRRAISTYSVMAVFESDWVWSELNVADFNSKCIALGIKTGTDLDNNAARLESLGTRDAKLKLLQERLSIGIQLARRHFRKQPEKLATLRKLRAGRRTIRATLADALEWEKAWGTVDAAYVPEAGNTLAAFQELRAQCVGATESVSNARSVRRKSSGARRAALDELWELCVDWYAEARIRFPASSAHGMTLRAEIPRQKRRKKVKKTTETE